MLAGAKALAGHDPASDPGDLAELLALLGDARVVGLGEDTHGTREVFRFKHRLVRQLVERHGFRLFAIEAGLAECRRLDDYVRRGVGDPAVALASTRFWTWDSAEVVDLVEHLRAWNEAHPDDVVSVTGIDGQFPQEPLAQALALLDPREAGPLAAALSPVSDDVLLDGYSALDEPTLDQLAAAADALYEASTPGLGRALANCVVAALAQRRASGRESGVSIRDRAMARTFLELMSAAPGCKAVLWAHNGHVGRQPFEGAALPLGAHLSEALGADYRVVAFSSGSGRVSAIPHDGSTPQSLVLPLLPGALPEAVLRKGAELGAEVLWAPLRPDAPRCVERLVGAVLSEDVWVESREVDPGACYDVLVGFPVTSASRLLPTSARAVATAWPLLPRPDAAAEGDPPLGLYASMAGPRDALSVVAGEGGVVMTQTSSWGSVRVGRRWRVEEPGRAVHVTASAALDPGVRAHVVVVQRRGDGSICSWRAHRIDAGALEPVRVEVPYEADAATASVAVAATGAGTTTVRALRAVTVDTDHAAEQFPVAAP